MTPAQIRELSLACDWTAREQVVILQLFTARGPIPAQHRPILGSALEKLFMVARAQESDDG